MRKPNLLFVSGWASDKTIWEKMNPLPGCCNEQNTLEWWDGLDGGLKLKSTPEEKQQKHTRVGVGWSMGGLLLLEAVAKGNITLERLVLISSTARMTSDNHYSGVSAKVLRAMQMRLRSEPSKVVEDFFRQAFSPFSDMPGIEKWGQRGQSIDVAKLKKGLQYLEQTDLRESLKKITIPTLVIHGEDDAIIPVENARYLADHLPQSNWVSLPGQGHALPITASDELDQIIESFTQ